MCQFEGHLQHDSTFIVEGILWVLNPLLPFRCICLLAIRSVNKFDSYIYRMLIVGVAGIEVIRKD